MVDDYARALLHALARDEAAGRRTPRLTEAGLATWQRFRGRLGAADLLRLLAEDAAVGYPIPFDLRTHAAELDLARVDDDLVEAWLRDLPSLDLAQPGPAYLEDQAKRLGVPSRLARTELHQVKQHQKVLELPGTGGQLSYHIVTTQDEPTLQVNCTIACGDWRELALAGIAALDAGAPPDADFIVPATAAELASDQHPLRQKRFDFVVGLRPDKGGKFAVADQLALWFHGARIVLV
ncbi:MAG: hypothetical protein KC464_07350 [Myxococcales bacterium]|nr:hypothetical protein [Myxococcales bacterium]